MEVRHSRCPPRTEPAPPRREEDKIAEHAAICQERGVDQKDSITFTMTEGDPVCEAAMALAANEVSDVIAVDEGYYIFLAKGTDRGSAAIDPRPAPDRWRRASCAAS